MKKLIAGMFMVCFAWAAMAQSALQPVKSQYMFNGMLINPAYAGSHEALSLIGTYRQWMALEQNYSFGMHAPLLKNRSGLGFSVQMNNYSVPDAEYYGLDQGQLSLDYVPLRFPLWKGKFSFGFRFSADLLQTNSDRIDLDDPDDPAFLNLNSNRGMFNAGTGLYYYGSKLYMGLSVPRFFNFPEGAAESGFFKGDRDFRKFNYLFTSGYNIVLNPDFIIKPSFLTVYQASQDSIAGAGLLWDANCSFLLFRQSLNIGGSYRSNGVAIALLEIQILRQIRVGASWDFPVGAIKQAPGALELCLRMDFDFKVSAVSPKIF